MFSLLGVLVAIHVTCATPATTTAAAQGYNETLALRMCRYSFAAYQWTDGYPRIAEWNCTGCCSLVGGVSRVSIFRNDSEAAFGYVVGSDAELGGAVVVAFRGTLSNDLTNWLEDLKFARTSPYRGNETVRVHMGFYSTYLSVRPQVRALLQKLGAGASKIFITGHSLGAALAELCALDLQEDPLPVMPSGGVQCLTFGTPRVGNQAFSSYYESFYPQWTSIRVVHWRDLVAHLPPRKWGWELTRNEIWYDEHFSTILGVCQEPESSNCSDHLTRHSIADHLSYFNMSHYHCEPA